ncbi:peptidylprolyl isomerase [Burkholderiaceae bacterium DAT-1]|nr:peptidylprolyl isomerase [Burkholderiaceae bacterium DAT-1]
MMTSVGELVFGLANAKAPITTANFLKYVNAGFYSGTVFHRIMGTFVAQGGGYTFVNGQFSQKNTPFDPIALEPTTTTGLSNTSYTLAMARTDVLNSATSQFYINLVDNSSLLNASASNANTGYAVFGSVISGVGTTTTALQSTQVQSNGSEVSLPIKPPVIYWAYQLK